MVKVEDKKQKAEFPDGYVIFSLIFFLIFFWLQLSKLTDSMIKRQTKRKRKPIQAPKTNTASSSQQRQTTGNNSL